METIGFEKKIRALKLRYYAFFCLKVILFCLFIFSFLSMAVTGLNLFTDLNINLGKAFWGAGVMSGIAGGLFLFFKRPSFTKSLILADGRFDLMDLLSTAVECHEKKKNSIHMKALIHEADIAISQKGISKIIPLRLPRYFFLFFLFSGMGLLFYFYPLFYTVKPRDISPDPEIQAFSEKMKAFAEELDKTSLSRQIQETSQKITASGETRKEAVKSLSGLLDSLEKENLSNLDELEKKLNLEGNLKDIPSPEPVEGVAGNEKKIRIDLKKLTDKVDEAFGDKVPEELKDALNDLKKSEEFKDQLKDMVDRLENESKDKKENRRNQGDDGTIAGESEPDGKSTGKKNGAMGEDKDNEAAQKYYAGKKKAEGKQEEPSVLKSSDSPIARDFMGAYERGKLQYSIRALSLPGLSARTEEAIQKEYMRQNEAVLLKEKIPPAYLELVRDYFLSIGLETDKKEKEHE